MPTKLIILDDGSMVEVEATEQEAQLVSSFSEKVAEKVEGTFQNILPVIRNAVKPIKEAWVEISQDMDIEQAELELGLSFEGEGNVYITKSKAGANLTIKLILKPKQEQAESDDKP